MPTPFAAIDAGIASATLGLLADVVAVRSDGLEFEAELDTADETTFDVLTAGSHVLEYAASVALSAGDALTIDGRLYKVVGVPRRKGTHICIAELCAL